MREPRFVAPGRRFCRGGRRGFAAPAAALLLLGAPAGAAAPNAYDRCMARVAEDPTAGEAEAARWRQSGGGLPARHCHAMALAALGAEARAGAELAALGGEAGELPPEERARILAQAAEFFLAAGEPEAAGEAVSRALLLAPDPALHTLAARSAAARGRWAEAVLALDTAIEIAPSAGRAALRATAYNRLGQASAARADALWALEMAPGDPDGLLALGSAEAALGNRPAAREAFLQAIEADRGGPVAEFARRRLQALEAGG
ncbi:MAG: hypothetical protein AAF074_10290 [Pseudomonadota bacterium]